jgi:hypothetical protein
MLKHLFLLISDLQNKVLIDDLHILYGGFENEKKKGKFFLTLWSGDLNVMRSNPGNLLKEIGL